MGSHGLLRLRCKNLCTRCWSNSIRIKTCSGLGWIYAQRAIPFTRQSAQSAESALIRIPSGQRSWERS